MSGRLVLVDDASQKKLWMLAHEVVNDAQLHANVES